jgi:uncharacterized protein (UPF0332 family)
MLASALERLRMARVTLDADGTASAVSDAYYAMLYAARAALSEADYSAKTHKGTWDLFWRTFVIGAGFDADVTARARARQEVREAADYGAVRPAADEAEAVVADAERFVAAVRQMLGGDA